MGMLQRMNCHANHVYMDCGEENASKCVDASITRGSTLIKLAYHINNCTILLYYFLHKEAAYMTPGIRQFF